MQPSSSRRSVLTNQNSGSNDSCHASTKTTVEHNRQCLVHNDVAEQQCNQNPVLSLLQELENSFGISLLRVVRILGDNLQIDTVLTHQSNGQTGESTTKENQEHGSDVEDPELGAWFLLVAVMKLLHDANRSSRGADGEEGFGESEDGGTEGHQWMGGVTLRTHGCGRIGRVSSDGAG